MLEQAREVTIKLHSRAGRFLKLQLYFAARWIMLSEVIFESGKRKISYSLSFHLCSPLSTSFLLNRDLFLGVTFRNSRDEK